MRKTARQVSAMAMAAAMLSVTLAGCGSSESANTSTTAAPTTAAAAEAAGGESAAPAEAEAPAASDKPYEGTKLTWWTKLNANVSATYPNLGDTPWAQYVQEQTGIEIEFIHPTVGSEKEEFSILVASGEYPDIIEHT